MPVIENWLKQPLDIVQGIFDHNQDVKCFSKKVEEYFLDKLKNKTNFGCVPSLNDIESGRLKSGSLVRFRGMIQDAMEPEYFIETYQMMSKVSNEVHTCSSRYKDMISCPDGMEISESPKNITGSRQVLYCVPIPGETVWTKMKYAEKYQTLDANVMLTSDQHVLSGSKRPIHSTESCTVEGDTNSNKRIKLTTCETNSSFSPDAVASIKLKYPLPDENGSLCIVKVYDEDMEIKVNDIFEFIGILSLESLSTENHEDFTESHSFTSFVPRLHCVAINKLYHSNPLLDNIFMEKEIFDFMNNACDVRQEIITFLKKALLGDELAAEYLLCNLVSNVYLNTETLAVGKLSLNLSKIPTGTAYPQLLASFLSNLVCKFYYLPMTLDKINLLKFIPTKNYSSNSLESGVLQLSEGTHFFVDETVMMPGQLDANGVKNIQALASLIKMQKVDYDFKFHSVPFRHNVKVLVLSEGKSMLPCDCQIPLLPENPVPNDLDTFFGTLKLPEDLMDKFRAYLTYSHSSSYEVDQSMVTSIENDFVETRQRDGRDSMTTEDLHLQLTLARSICKSLGNAKLDPTSWEKVKCLEKLRKDRL